MAKAIKCELCGNWYNGTQYDACPYCQKSESEIKEETPKKKKLFGLLFSNNEKPKSEDSAFRTEGDTVDKTERVRAPYTSEKEESNDEAVTCFVDVSDSKENFESQSTSENQEIVNTEEEKAEEKKAEEESVLSGLSEQKTVDTSNAIPLSKGINISGRTVGKYVSNSSGEEIMPVVGWIVGVKGDCYGQSFNLRKGRNRIGRSHEFEIKLLNDTSVSRTCVATIIYEPKKSEFMIIPGESDTLCYVNGEALYERMQLYGYEELELGDLELNKYIFVPFCNENVNWNCFPKE